MISCNQYDYIEIVCMYRYPITLHLKSGQHLECTAIDTKRNDQKEECIQVSIQDSFELVVLDDIAKLEVHVENPHFQQISFE